MGPVRFRCRPWLTYAAECPCVNRLAGSGVLHVVVMPPPDSYGVRLQEDLAAIKAELDGLLDRSSILNVDPNRRDSGIFFVGAAQWGWGPSDADTHAMQMELLARYREWFDRFVLLFPHPTKEIKSRIEQADKFVQRWINHEGRDCSIPPSIGQAKGAAAQQFREFEDLLGIVSGSGEKKLRLVPDTNALLRNPSVEDYATAVGSSDYMVHIPTAVLSELDDLKDRGRTPDVREQAERVVRRLKGFRDRGRISEGVKVAGNVWLKLEHREVDARSALSWLDPTVPDDRIVAAALRLQSDNPAGVVVLVTADINLQNKAESVGLPYAEPPKSQAAAQPPKP